MKRKGCIKIGRFRLSTEHLFLIFILGVIFTSAFVMRSFPLQYGFYLHEYDPYFNYRATQYLLQNGIDSYLSWHDTMSWYPDGRDVAKTSQSGLHIVTAIMYLVFGHGISLLNFVIIFPVIVSSLTTIVFYCFIKLVTSRTSIGLFAALLFAVSPPLVIRGSMGWFKSEPLGLFLGLIALCLFVILIKETRTKYFIPLAMAGGIILGIGIASWNGVQYFAIPISIFLFILPFYREGNRKLKYSIVIFTVFVIITTASFPRSGISSILSLPSIALVAGTFFFVLSDFLKGNTRFRKKEKRNVFFLLIAFSGVTFVVVFSGTYYVADVKYLAAINPFFDTPVFFESVEEHSRPSLLEYLIYFSTLLIPAVIGGYFILKQREKLLIFSLVIGVSGFYISTTFSRLLVFASIAVITFSSIGIQWILDFTSKNKAPTILATDLDKEKTDDKKQRKFEQKKYKTSKKIKILAPFVIVFMLLFFPMVYPPGLSWLDLSDVPPPIINGNTYERIVIKDWLDALDWLSINTSESSIIASWWDYGYWITTLGNRTTLADNAANNQSRIETIAKMFMDNPITGLNTAHSLKANYLLIYTVARNITVDGEQYYILGNGGLESKIYTIAKLAGYDPNKFLESDEFTLKPGFWNNTFLGKLMPYNHEGYIAFSQERSSDNGNTYLPVGYPLLKYEPGAAAIYSIKKNFSLNIDKTDLIMAYRSNSPEGIDKNKNIMTEVIVYKINKPL